MTLNYIKLQEWRMLQHKNLFNEWTNLSVGGKKCDNLCILVHGRYPQEVHVCCAIGHHRVVGTGTTLNHVQFSYLSMLSDTKIVKLTKYLTEVHE